MKITVNYDDTNNGKITLYRYEYDTEVSFLGSNYVNQTFGEYADEN